MNIIFYIQLQNINRIQINLMHCKYLVHLNDHILRDSKHLKRNLNINHMVAAMVQLVIMNYGLIMAT